MNLTSDEIKRVQEICEAVATIENHGGEIQLIKIRQEETRLGINPLLISAAVKHAVNYPTDIYDLGNPWQIKLSNTIPVEYEDKRVFTPISMKRLIKANHNKAISIKLKTLEELEANPLFGMF